MFVHKKGMTLIELMVVVAIIGILATVAYPNYQEYVRRGHRAEARAQLLEAAQFMERNFTLMNNYSTAAGGGALHYRLRWFNRLNPRRLRFTTLGSTRHRLRLPMCYGPFRSRVDPWRSIGVGR